MTPIYFLPLQTVERNNRSIMNVTPLRTNENYIVYYNFWTKTVLTEVLPYVLLVFFNGSIYRAIRRSLELQKSMRCTSSQQEEIKSANVVVRSMLCTEPRKKVGTWLRDISSWPCLAFLPGFSLAKFANLFSLP